MSRSYPSFAPIRRHPDDAISATLIRSIGGRISVYQPNPAQVRVRLATYRDKWPSVDVGEPPAEPGFDQQRLYRAIERRLVIERGESRRWSARRGSEPVTARFETWLQQERSRVRVRKVAPMTSSVPKP